MKILLVEDEKKIGEYVNASLKEAGYCTDWVVDGKQAYAFCMTYEYDLLVLDVMLPGLDGWRILELLRAQDKLTPVLMLTARDSIEDRVKGLNLGADDYLVKPFSLSELLARVNALLRRGSRTQAEALQVGDISLDLSKHEVKVAGKTIHLSPKEFSLLALFMKRKGQVLSRSVICEMVWGINFYSDTNVVDVAIKRLRDKLGIASRIKTVRGLGYRFEV